MSMPTPQEVWQLLGLLLRETCSPPVNSLRLAIWGTTAPKEQKPTSPPTSKRLFRILLLLPSYAQPNNTSLERYTWKSSSLYCEALAFSTKWYTMRSVGCLCKVNDNKFGLCHWLSLILQISIAAINIGWRIAKLGVCTR